MTTSADACPCGSSHAAAASWPLVRTLIEAEGPTVRLTVGARTWTVPRIYIAFHGIKADDVAELAKAFGWPEAS